VTRIGLVRYLNAAPLHTALDPQRYTLVPGHPEAVARALAAGEVDVALVPVGAIFADRLDVRIAPGWCIGCDGPVSSVLLVGESPPEDWTEVRLDGVSRTSALLARLLLTGPLARRCRSDLVITDVAPGTALDGASGSVAALTIGDAARALPARFAHTIDLGTAWRSWTGLPFVFAAWAGRPDLDPAVVADLRAAGGAGVADIPRAWRGADLTYLSQNIRYPLDDRALMGLRRFGALLAERGIGTGHFALYGPTPGAPRDPAAAALVARALDGERLSPVDEATLAHAPLTDLVAAADLRRALLFGEQPVVWGRAAAPETLAIGGGETDADRLALLATWRATPPAAMRVVAVERTGRVGTADNTAIDQLRWQAIARLLGPPVPLVGAEESEGTGMTQLGLAFGVDSWGPTADPVRVEREIREAGRIAAALG
jgi:predicted solute-binding protein